MTEHTPSSQSSTSIPIIRKRSGWITAISIFVAVCSLLLGAYSIILFFKSVTSHDVGNGILGWASFSAMIAGLLALTSLGLWHMRKWAVVLFLVLGLAGSANGLVRELVDIGRGDVIGIYAWLVNTAVVLCVAGLLWKAVEATSRTE